VLNFKELFRIYNLSLGRSVNQIISMVVPKSIYFSLNSGMPLIWIYSLNNLTIIIIFCIVNSVKLIEKFALIDISISKWLRQYFSVSSTNYFCINQIFTLKGYMSDEDRSVGTI
jgi:hypothetical protein